MNTIKLQKTNTSSIYCYKKKAEHVQDSGEGTGTAPSGLDREWLHLDRARPVVIIGRFSAAAAEDEEVGVYCSRQASASTSARRV
jgi:hypothetical protein